MSFERQKKPQLVHAVSIALADFSENVRELPEDMSDGWYTLPRGTTVYPKCSIHTSYSLVDNDHSVVIKDCESGITYRSVNYGRLEIIASEV